MFKLKKLVAIIMLAALVLTSCSSGGTSSDKTTPASTDAAQQSTETLQEEQPSVSPGAKGIIEFWSVFTGADGISMQEMVDKYNSGQPDYTVNHRAIAADDLYLKLPLTVQSGDDVPDIAINHVERLTMHYKNGILTDISSLLESAGISKDSYVTKVWEASDIDGGHYAVPLDSTAFAMYVNMDLYEKYGSGALDDGIVTWDEIKTGSKLAKADGIVGVGLGWLRANWLSAYGQLGGKMSADGQTPDFDDPNSKKALNLWREIYDAGYTNKEGDAPFEMFVGGQTMYLTEGSWMLNQVVESGVNYKVVDFPVFNTAAKGHWTSSHQFVLPRNEKRSEEQSLAALQFIKAIGEDSMVWAKAGQIPAYKAVVESAEFDSLPQAFLGNSDNSTLKVFTYLYYGFGVESLDRVLPEILYGRISVDEGLAQAVQETKDRISAEG